MSDSPTKQIRFEYLKSTFFRVVHADGAYGGPTPQLGGLCITFFSERFPIPKSATYNVNASGQLQEEVASERESRSGIIREAEVAVILDLVGAKSLVSWLADKISEIEKQKEESKLPALEITKQ
jgi:hypothetical protein